MKRRLGTIVLFVLLILTAVALQKTTLPTTTVSATGEVQTLSN